MKEIIAAIGIWKAFNMMTEPFEKVPVDWKIIRLCFVGAALAALAFAVLWVLVYAGAHWTELSRLF